MLNHSFQLTKFSILTSGFSIHRFHFFFFGIFNTGNFSGFLRVRGGKFPCGPDAGTLAGQSCYWLNCFCLSTYAVWELPHSSIAFSLSVLWHKQPLSTDPDLNFYSISLSLSHMHTNIHTPYRDKHMDLSDTLFRNIAHNILIRINNDLSLM